MPGGLFNGLPKLKYLTIPFVGTTATATYVNSLLGKLFSSSSATTTPGADYHLVTQKYYASASATSLSTYKAVVPNTFSKLVIAGRSVAIPQYSAYGFTEIHTLEIGD